MLLLKIICVNRPNANTDRAYFILKLPQNLQPPRVRFYVRVPGGEGGIGTKSHGHDSSIRIPNFSHIQARVNRISFQL